MNGIYKRIKRIVIIPLLCCTILTGSLYYTYITPTVVAAGASTAVLDWLMTALSYLGFGITSRQQAQNARSDFSQWLADNLPDNWEYFGASEVINVVSGGTPTAMSIYWYASICHYFGVEKVNKAVNGIGAIPETLVQAKEEMAEHLGVNEDLSSWMSSVVGDVSGLFSALLVLVRGWMNSLTEKIGEFKDWATMKIGEMNAVAGAALKDTTFYQILVSEDIRYFIKKHFVSSSYVCDAGAYIEHINTLIDNFDNVSLNSYIQSCNDTYLVMLNCASRNHALYIYDIPDDCTELKYTKRSWSYGTLYDVVSVSNGQEQPLTGIGYNCNANTGEWGNQFSTTLSSISGFRNGNLLTDLCLFEGIVVGTANFYLSVPVGISCDQNEDAYIPVTCNIDNWDDARFDYAGHFIDDIDFNNSTAKPFDIEKTNDFADITDIPIDLADTDVVAIPADKLIEDAANADTDAITDALDQAVTDTKTETSELPDTDKDNYKIQLAQYFPFCIPFDIFNFFKCLVREPETPNFVIKLPLLGETYEFNIDLGFLNPVAKIIRMCELFMFCIGLALATNSLIKH